MLNIGFDIKNLTPYFTIVIAILLVSKIPTLAFKKISISPKTTVFLLLGIGITEYILVSRGAIMGLIPIVLLFIYITNKPKLNINISKYSNTGTNSQIIK